MTGALNFFDRTYSNPANPVALNAAERQKRAFFYGEDTWQVSSRLTVNYGLRWELYFPQYVNQPGAGGFLLIHDNMLPDDRCGDDQCCRFLGGESAGQCADHLQELWTSPWGCIFGGSKDRNPRRIRSKFRCRV